MKSSSPFVVAALVLAFPGVAAAAETVVITKADCQRLVKYIPEAGVDYEPGKDAYGRKVAPADLGGGYGWIKPPEVITFDMQVNLRNFRGGPAADAQAQTAAIDAAGKAANAAAISGLAATTAEAAAAADPANADLAAAAAAARAAATAANNAVTAGEKSAAANEAAAATAAASAADPGNAALAAASQALDTASQDAAAANTALEAEFKKAARVDQFFGWPVVGNVTVVGDQVYWNGRPLEDPDQAEIEAACRKALAAPR